MATIRDDVTLNVNAYTTFKYDLENLQKYLNRQDGFSTAKVCDSITMRETLCTIALGFTLTTDIGERIHNRVGRLLEHLQALDKKTETALELKITLDMLEEDAK